MMEIDLPEGQMKPTDQIADDEAGRISLHALAADALVLCATHRLARDLRREHDALQMAAGLQRWPALRSLTLAQWLEACLNEALLLREIDLRQAPRLLLTTQQEGILWERAIAAANAELDAAEADSAAIADLFDLAGMARAAAEANALMLVWDIRIPSTASEQSEETRQFLRWRAKFQSLCEEAGALEAARYFAWQLDCLEQGAGRLPPQLAMAGYDRYNPQELRLVRILRQRGVAVYELEQGLADALLSAAPVHQALPDRLTECRAAVAWVQQRLAAQPAARLGIVVPELSALRDRLIALLDDALDPVALNPAHAEMPRHYNFSLGLPLARQGLVDVALHLLALFAQPHKIAQQDFAVLLCQPYWSADVSEADARAQLDARMRAQLAPQLSLEQLLRFIARQTQAENPSPLHLSCLQQQLEACRAWLDQQAARQAPSAWAQNFAKLLELAAWPGERSLSSHEYQARRAFDGVLEALCALDAVLGRASFAEAYQYLQQLCHERIFQAQTEGDPPVQIMGLLEAAGTPLDALWVMGMNDHLWPPAARPNPLLPAESQRQVRSPNASAEVQHRFATKIHQRLLRSAPELVFSYAKADADRELRPSPLLALNNAVTTHAPLSLAPTRRDRLAGSAVLEMLADHRAPAVAEGERLRGGTALLKAQAICPAWAFYRYRLGARALEAAQEGLDSAERGTLLHAVLQAFWHVDALPKPDSQSLQALTAEQRSLALTQAIDQALTAFNAEREQALSAHFLDLERERLQKLIAAYLDLEAERSVPFQVLACEKAFELTIEGIQAKVVIDRIDALEDGRQIIIDYKTGATISQASWGEQRITEPQLPIYAALALEQGSVSAAEAKTEAPPPAVAAVAFAKVRFEDYKFIGIAAETGLLPKVESISSEKSRKLFPEQQTWPALLDHWRQRLAAIACEIKEGEAAVSFRQEADLKYCEVLPLLRLAERQRLAALAAQPIAMEVE